MTMKEILHKMLIMMLISLIQLIGVIIEGISRFFGKIAEYLERLHDRLLIHLENRNLYGKCTAK